MENLFEKQLESIINEYEGFDPEGISLVKLTDLETRCIASIERITGQKSPYSRMLVEIKGRNFGYFPQPMTARIRVSAKIGVAKGLLSDIQNGYLKSFEEILHGDLFNDFLEMAGYLSENGYKDAAAVIAGSTLEVHIRKLCEKYDVPVTSKNKMKKTDTLNAELVKAGAYNKSDQKTVTACLGIRNSASHGHYSEYDNDRVKLLIDQIRHFISKHPA